MCRCDSSSSGVTSVCSRTAGSATPPPADAAATHGACVAVAYSGGVDSTALLHATLRAARPLGLSTVALHVHHGLSPNADAWLAHCRDQCARWHDDDGHALVFAFERLETAPARGDSIEAWARRERYRALHRLATAHGASLVLLAQHRRDQAETFLLQALRGAGVAGTSSMPRSAARDGLQWARPWLREPHAKIEQYLAAHRLRFVEDESNRDRRPARSRLRTRVWPTLVGAFPQAESTLADAAEWAQQAAACLDEVARDDLAVVAGAASGALDIGAWTRLSPPRRSNVMRAWLVRESGQPARAALVRRLLDELPAARVARWPLPHGELRSYRGLLACATLPDIPTDPMSASSPREAHLRIERAGDHALPGWGGVLRVVETSDPGVGLDALGRLDLVARSGAEQFQRGAGRPRALKKQYQAAGIAAWDRRGPLVYRDGRLLFVPGLGLDGRIATRSGDAGCVRLEWIDDLR